MVISALADSVLRGAETVGDSVSERFFEPTIRLGVTGLARSGKTVFITALVANMLNRGRMLQVGAIRDGRIEAAYLQPQPDDTVPRFDYETHFADLTAPVQTWPESTRSISELRLSLRVKPSGLLSGFKGTRTVHIDIVDYPGEWLLDLGLLDKSYATWSAETLARMQHRESAHEFLQLLDGCDPDAAHDEVQAKAMARAFAGYLGNARMEGFSDCTPGRFLLPGDLEGSPVLTFAPLRITGQNQRRSLMREFERRFEAYKSQVVKPFFRNHFARLDRQIVLVDVLGAVHAGPRAVEDLRLGMADILSAFRPGRNAFLSRILRGKRVEKILFAATKADHLHHTQHPQLSALIEALTAEARDRARFAGAETASLSLASLRATTEEMRTVEGNTVPCVRGILAETGKQAVFSPGSLPDDPSQLLSMARKGGDDWNGDEYRATRFAPAPLSLKPGDGPPHIRLDRAVEFLIGDQL